MRCLFRHRDDDHCFGVRVVLLHCIRGDKLYLEADKKFLLPIYSM
jgi:hypothetical protein